MGRLERSTDDAVKSSRRALTDAMLEDDDEILPFLRSYRTTQKFTEYRIHFQKPLLSV